MFICGLCVWVFLYIGLNKYWHFCSFYSLCLADSIVRIHRFTFFSTRVCVCACHRCATKAFIPLGLVGKVCASARVSVRSHSRNAERERLLCQNHDLFTRTCIYNFIFEFAHAAQCSTIGTGGRK